MNGTTRSAFRLLVVATTAVATAPAHASLVIDIPNLIVNTLIKKELIQIKKELHDKEAGTVNYNTLEINKTTQLNYAIDNDFTWIINQGGDEIIPIPKVLREKLDDILGGNSVETYTSNYRKAEDFKHLPEDGYKAAVEGSRSRKAANDALVLAVSTEKEAFENEFKSLAALAEMNGKAQGQGHQMQLANALAASQVNQTMRLRSMVLVSEAAHAAEAQVAADRDARAIAIGKHMRGGLDSAISHSVAPSPKY
jgi:conjugal transfer/entry exclusion protein